MKNKDYLDEIGVVCDIIALKITHFLKCFCKFKTIL